MYANNGNTKTIPVSLAGQGKVLEVEVEPSTTMGEALVRLGLSPGDHDVAAPTGDRLLGLDERPWDLVQSAHDAIVVTPSAQVGWSSLSL